jgi:hypothetical protein
VDQLTYGSYPQRYSSVGSLTMFKQPTLPVLASVAAIVWGIAVLVGVFVGAPLLLGLDIDAGLVINALAAAGAFSAAAAALWIATTDRRTREQEREDADRKQAGLVRIKAGWQSLGRSRDVDPHVQVIVNNWANLPIVDVELTRWEWEGHEAKFSKPQRIEAVMPSPVVTGDRAGVLTVVPTDDATKTALAEQTITPDTDLTVTVEFTDAGAKRWRRSSKGLLEQVRPTM